MGMDMRIQIEEESFRIKGKGGSYAAETTTSLHLRIIRSTDSSMQLSECSFLCEVWTKTLVRLTSRLSVLSLFDHF